jgi:hypothetical protein
MRADEQKSDMRRDTQGRGCNTTGSPPVIEKAYHVDPAVTHGKQSGEPREIPAAKAEREVSRRHKRWVVR